MYNRAVRVHNYIYEALLHLAWKCFIPWLEAHHPNQIQSVSAFLDQVSDACGEMSQAKLDELLSSDGLVDSFILWNLFLSHLRHDNGNLYTFWMSYADMVGDILLGLIRASRERAIDSLYLFAIRKMIPWCVAYDLLNYARYLPSY